MGADMIAGIILFGVGVLVFIAGVVLGDREGEGYIFLGCIVCVIGFFIMLSCVWTAKEAEPTETIYPLAVRVSTIDREADVVECIDGAGNIWKFVGCEDWQEGDFAALLMNDKGTPSIYDDEIITARYARTFGD